MSKRCDVLVIGAGLAGLTAAWQASQQGKKVTLLAKGWGAIYWHAGCVDVLGYWPLESDTAVANPGHTIPQLATAQPQHPYAHLGVARLQAALTGLQALCAEAGYPLAGALDRNWQLPSAVGTFRPTCLAPETMTAGDLSHDAPMLLVGFKQLPDFFPQVAADNLSHQGIPARAVTLDLPALARRNFTTAVILARMMEQPDFRAELVKAAKPHLKQAQRVGFPAVLGLHQATAVHQDLQAQFGLPVFEIPGLPPSVPGMRLHHILKTAIERNGGRVFDGMEVLAADAEDGRVTAVYTESAARRLAHRCEQAVLATGGILGGGITANPQGKLREVVFDLPVHAPPDRLGWFRPDFLDNQGHPVYRSGIAVTANFQPADDGGRPIYRNLYAAGTTLAHAEVIRERSFDGVALGTGYTAAACLGQ